jgi:hypothetical protein
MLHWGTAPELTEEFGGDPVPPNPQGEILEHLGHIGHVMAELMTELGPGLVLHAEQDYEYHRPILVGDVLRGENAISDVYRRADKTFVVIETHWVDVRTGNPVLTGRFGVVHISDVVIQHHDVVIGDSIGPREHRRRNIARSAGAGTRWIRACDCCKQHHGTGDLLLQLTSCVSGRLVWERHKICSRESSAR